jgi:ubiquinone/menaquinone biosynthesis C-methylase UbiE
MVKHFPLLTGMDRAPAAAYLSNQYGTTEKLDARIEAHQRYSERPDDYLDWVLDHLEPHPGDLALDVGCGKGSYHPLLIARGVRAILGVDTSPAMVAATQRQADERRLPAMSIEGNAERLPLPDASYDVAMANHVLFLIADQQASLRDLRRVLKSSGGVVLTTNAEGHSARLEALHRAAAQRLGYQPVERVTSRFHFGHLAMVRTAFPTAECFVREDAFLFPSTDAALRYYGSGMIDAIVDPPDDGGHRAQLLALVGDEIDAIIRCEGVFRVPKDSGCFVARV